MLKDHAAEIERSAPPPPAEWIRAQINAVDRSNAGSQSHVLAMDVLRQLFTTLTKPVASALHEEAGRTASASAARPINHLALILDESADPSDSWRDTLIVVERGPILWSDGQSIMLRIIPPTDLPFGSKSVTLQVALAELVLSETHLNRAGPTTLELPLPTTSSAILADLSGDFVTGPQELPLSLFNFRFLIRDRV